MRVLAVGAHSDDADLFCGGTLARYVQQGHEVGICCLTDGRANGSAASVEALVRIRQSEFEASAAVIGAAQTYWPAFPDAALTAGLTERAALVEIFKDFRPDVLLTHPADDYHPDHTAAHQLVVDASLFTWFINHAFAPIYFWEAEGGHNFLPEEYVDITAVFDQKCQMMEAHRSQYEIHQDPQAGQMENYLTQEVIALARFRGMQSGVQYAEGFTACRKHGRVRTYRMLP